MQSSTELPHEPQTGWTLDTALTLGRVSNLPTVWTNALAGIILAGGGIFGTQSAALLFAMSLAYIGGMFLNDAFDHEIDSIQRPERPIPAGLVSARDVYIAGFAMLFLSVALIHLASPGNPAATVSALALVSLIILYNCWHKENPISPLLMGLCRMMVYICCGLVVSNEISMLLAIGSLITLSYLIGLTYTAKQEHFGRISKLWPLAFLSAPILMGIYVATDYPSILFVVAILAVWIAHCLSRILRRQAGDIPVAVVRLIAGISIIDTLLMLSAMSLLNSSTSIEFYNYLLAAIGFTAFACTLFLQRYIAGT
ncbi:MAG: UbiA family prenyltransferase [Granulosicoccus sp.]